MTSEIYHDSHLLLFFFFFSQAFSPPTKCDFEDAGLCSWEHHDSSDVRWSLHSGATATSRTGPAYDHTLGAHGKGCNISIIRIILQLL